MEFDCGSFFKAVADPSRVRMMLLLCGKELTVTELCRHFKMRQPSVSHHLGILKNAKIVESRKEGREVYYRLNECCVTSCCADFMKRFAGKADAGAKG
ncbi:MAG: winged helix-turn-helix transcriptional regulator [Elusimicrobia bacterium]|nr:winged helix-turn-helix transcriptional regulator [Elusimicrobiota bacterium]